MLEQRNPKTTGCVWNSLLTVLVQFYRIAADFGLKPVDEGLTHVADVAGLVASQGGWRPHSSMRAFRDKQNWEVYKCSLACAVGWREHESAFNCGGCLRVDRVGRASASHAG
jgi:hypothetical protein